MTQGLAYCRQETMVVVVCTVLIVTVYGTIAAAADGVGTWIFGKT
jgi:hypothetical protein